MISRRGRGHQDASSARRRLRLLEASAWVLALVALALFAASVFPFGPLDSVPSGWSWVVLLVVGGATALILILADEPRTEAPA